MISYLITWKIIQREVPLCNQSPKPVNSAIRIHLGEYVGLVPAWLALNSGAVCISNPAILHVSV